MVSNSCQAQPVGELVHSRMTRSPEVHGSAVIVAGFLACQTFGAGLCSRWRQIRNPNVEIRYKFEIPNPKARNAPC